MKNILLKLSCYILTVSTIILIFITNIYGNDTNNMFNENIEQQQDIDLTDGIEILIELITNLDEETLMSIADFLGVEYDQNNNKQHIITSLIRAISRNYEIINSVRNIDGKMSFKQSIGDTILSIQSNLSFKRDIQKGNQSYTQYLFLFCSVDYSDYQFNTDSIIINIESQPDGNTSLSDIEIMAGGNITFNWGNFNFYADKAFFYPAIMRGLFYNIKVYAPDIYGILVEASEAKIISADEIILIDVILSGDDNLSNPHYKLHLEKVWLYPDMDTQTLKNLFASHLIFQVGQTPLFYFPLWFQTGFSSGIRVSMKYEQSIGFYIQTTTGFSIGDFSNTLIADYYQKMGLYFSLAEELTLLSFIDIDVSIAYDRAVEYVGRSSIHWGKLSNYVDIDNDGITDETYNSLRYYIGIDAPYTIYKGKKVLYDGGSSVENRKESLIDVLFSTGNGGLSDLLKNYIDKLYMGLNFDFMNISDPNFEEQFIDFPRSEYFILSTDIIYKEKTIAVYTPDAPGSSSNAMSLNTGLTISTVGFKIDIKGSWIWSFRSRYGELNPYDVLNYYALQPFVFKFPEISVEYKSALSNNLFDDLIKAGLMIFNPDISFSSLSHSVHGMILSLPINYEIVINYTSRKLFVEDDTDIKDPSENENNDSSYEEILEEDIKYTRAGLAYSLPFTIGYDFVKYTLKMGYDIDYKQQNTIVNLNDSEEDISTDDSIATGFEWQWFIESTLVFDILDMYEYLNLNFGVDIEYKYEGQFNDLAFYLGFNNTEQGTSLITYSGEALEFTSIYINFLKTDIELTGVNIPLQLNDEDRARLGELIRLTDSNGESLSIIIDKEYLLQQKRNEYYELSIENTLFSGFTLSLNYKEKSRLDYIDYKAGGREEAIDIYNLPSIFGGRGHKLEILSKYRLKSDILLFNTINLNDIRLNIQYNHFYGTNGSKKDSINLAFFVDFEILPYWRFSISYEVENKNLWKYCIFGYTHPDNTNPRRLLEDIWWGLSIWDAEKLQKSYWKIKSLSINIDHDLAEWRLLMSLQFYPRIYERYIVFQPIISITILFLDFPDFSGGAEGNGQFDNLIYDRI